MSEKIQEQVEKEKYRRRCIVDLMKDQGFYSVKNLQELLKDVYGVEVSRETLYSDLARIDGFKREDLSAFNNKLIANCEAHLDNLNHMSKNAKYEQYRIKAIDSYFKNVVEMKKVINLLVRSNEKPVEKLDDVDVVEDEDVNVEFGE